MKPENWKILAIVLLIVVIVETSLIGWFWLLGAHYLEKESECSINVCGDKMYESYYYDDYEGICYCFADGEVAYQEYIG